MQLRELGDWNFGKPAVWSTGKALVGGLGKEVPQKPKPFAHLHIIFWHHTAKNTVDTNRLTPLLEGLGAVQCSPSWVQGQSPCSGGLGAKPPPRSWKLFAAQVADFCLIRRFFLGGGYKTGGNIPLLRMPRINTDHSFSAHVVQKLGNTTLCYVALKTLLNWTYSAATYWMRTKWKKAKRTMHVYRDIIIRNEFLSGERIELYL